MSHPASRGKGGWSIGQLLPRAGKYLEGKGVDSPRLTAEILLSSVLGCSRLQLYLDYHRKLAEEELSRYREILKRRAQGAPTQYLVGRASFFGYEFIVREGVFIPRPETELLVRLVLERVKKGRVLDIGTGCGNIAISLALSDAQLQITATDISDISLDVARENLRKFGLEDRVELVKADLFDGLSGSFDCIVSNPPYIPREELERCQREVREYEPWEALCGGEDGLDIIKRLLEGALDFLASWGCVVVEIGTGQREVVLNLAEQHFLFVSIFKDFNQIERAVVAERGA